MPKRPHSSAQHPASCASPQHLASVANDRAESIGAEHTSPPSMQPRDQGDSAAGFCPRLRLSEDRRTAAWAALREDLGGNTLLRQEPALGSEWVTAADMSAVFVVRGEELRVLGQHWERPTGARLDAGKRWYKVKTLEDRDRGGNSVEGWIRCGNITFDPPHAAAALLADTGASLSKLADASAEFTEFEEQKAALKTGGAALKRAKTRASMGAAVGGSPPASHSLPASRSLPVTTPVHVVWV
jgi:hypothetical protein